MQLQNVSAPPAADSACTSSLSEVDLQRVLLEWNNTSKAYPADKCIQELVEMRAAQRPLAPAAESGSRTLTYAELNSRANQLASILRRNGVGPDVPVAICLKRSLELLVAFLGVLKAGGACVPLDPDYPGERLSYILEDSQARILITQAALRPLLGDTQAEIFLLECGWELLNRESGETAPISVSPSNLAYIIYTSGSTGKPRGVLLTHRGLVNHGIASIGLYGLTPADRVLQFASISFDIAIEEIFPTWFAGGCVVPRDEETPLTASEFSRWIEQRRISVLDLPTAYWHEWMHGLTETLARLPRSLRLVIVGGEKASSSAFAAWLKAGGTDVRWINTYGPTEASVIATAYEPNPKEPLPDNLPIGRPIANVQVYVLDPNLKPVPVGTVGELHIGGPGVARGYLNRPELTAAKFIANPFEVSGDARLYKTGDMVRYLANGNLEFVGRIDFQVKIRGFRVELGEVEAALEKHSGVAQAVVVAREGNGQKQLVAYIIATPEGVRAPELRDYAKKQLPAYMVPAGFVFLESFPFTPNGKVDRRALPEPTPQSMSAQEFVAPRDEFETRMAMLWAEVLDRPYLGIRDNFFDLGGHSLLALRLISRIERQFGKKLTLTSLLQAPTVEELVRLMSADKTSGSPLVVLQPAGSKPSFFFVHGLGGTVMRFRELARRMAPDQPFASFQAQGMDGNLPVLDNVEDMAALYLENMRTAQPNGPYYLGGYSFGGLVALEMARRLQREREEVALLALVDTYFTGQANSSLMRRFLSLSTHQKLAYVRKRAVRYGRGIKRRFDALFLPATVKAVRNACAIAEQRYQPSAYPGRVVLFRASDKALRGLEDGHHSWRRYAEGGFEVHEIEGDHGNVLNEPNVRKLAAALRLRLEQAQAEHRPALVIGARNS